MASSMAHTDITQVYERNQEATLYVGNLDLKANEELLYELFSQCGPLRNVHLPRDKVTGQHQTYAFIEFENETDADYALKIVNMVKLFGRPMKCNKASSDRRMQEVGANLFIGNLDPEVDEKLLFDTFSSFGVIVAAKVMRDPETGESKGFGFVSYDTFEASDACLAAMNNQFFCNRPIQVSYAYKKDTKGERHGSAAERLIAACRPQDRLRPQGLPPMAGQNLPIFPILPTIPPPPIMSTLPIPIATNIVPIPTKDPAIPTIPALNVAPPAFKPPLAKAPPMAFMPPGHGMNMARPPPIPSAPMMPSIPAGMPPMFFTMRPDMVFPAGMPPLPTPVQFPPPR